MAEKQIKQKNTVVLSRVTSVAVAKTQTVLESD